MRIRYEDELDLRQYDPEDYEHDIDYEDDRYVEIMMCYDAKK